MTNQIPEIKELSDNVSDFLESLDASIDTHKDDCNIDSINEQFHGKAVWENREFVGLSYVEVIEDIVKISFIAKLRDVSQIIPLPMFVKFSNSDKIEFTDTMQPPK